MLFSLNWRVNFKFHISSHTSRGERSFCVVNSFLLRRTSAMEMVQEYVKPLREFAKDSMRLVKRCTKPDLKGKFKIGYIFQPFLAPITVYCLITFRIPEDRASHGRGFRYHGFHRLLCQAHPHPHQQYHCVSLLFTSCQLDVLTRGKSILSLS